MLTSDISSRGDIELLVADFYASVREDTLLCHLFASHVGSDWSGHEARVCDFWETVLLGTSSRTRFKSRALLGHLTVDEMCPLCPFHFERWCSLFEGAVGRRFQGQRAERACERARAMSATLQAQITRERENGNAKSCPFASLAN